MNPGRPSSGTLEPPHLIAIGATTGVGGTGAVSMAAARAGLTGTERVSHGAGEDDWSNAVRVGTLDTVDREGRSDALLSAALAQIAPLLATAAPFRVRGSRLPLRQRLFQYSGRADTEPQHVALGLARIEGLLDAAVQGLADCGRRAWVHAEAALTERPSPSALYAAARVAFEARERERGARIINEHLTSAPGFALAARLSIEHAPPLGEQAAPSVEAWLRAGPRFSALGLRMAAHNGLKPALSSIRAAAEALSDDDEAEAAEFLSALCRLGSPETFELIGRWRLSRHARLRRCWANAVLGLGRGAGQGAVLARAEQDPAVARPIVERGASRSRLRGGEVASAAITLQQMERFHLPQRLRAYLGRELGVRWAVSGVPDVDGLLREQGPLLRALSRSPQVGRSGAWN